MNTADDLRKLEPDWDSYGAQPPTEEAIAAADKFVKGMVLVPMSDGGVQIECHAGSWEVEIEVDDIGKVRMVTVGRAET